MKLLRKEIFYNGTFVVTEVEDNRAWINLESGLCIISAIWDKTVFNLTLSILTHRLKQYIGDELETRNGRR